MKITTKMKMTALAGTAALATIAAIPASAEEPEALEDPYFAIEAKTRSAFDTVHKPDPERSKKPEAPAIPQPQNGTIEGVSLATLESIAACESGGDPTAVNAAGYYGKYQFDESTWASVGGSGNPAEASEAEQDYRAALLYSRAGSSPWPVCGS